MRKLILTSILLASIIGCKSYVQVFKTNSSINANQNGFYVYENDSVKIIYSFWQKGGLMTFAIYNKLDQPLFVDWKKSAYIDNWVKLNYWIDEVKSEGTSTSDGLYYEGPLLKPGYAISRTGRASITSTVKIERITFIPPKSYYFRSQFFIFPINFYQLSADTKYNEVDNKGNSKKKTKVYKQTFTKKTSPLVFRNYLTLSLSEDFYTEFYVDNEFYIEEILEMDKKHFGQYRIDETKSGKFFIKDKYGNPVLFSDFQSPTSFYLEIPREASIEKRN